MVNFKKPLDRSYLIMITFKTMINNLYLTPIIIKVSDFSFGGLSLFVGSQK